MADSRIKRPLAEATNLSSSSKKRLCACGLRREGGHVADLIDTNVGELEVGENVSKSRILVLISDSPRTEKANVYHPIKEEPEYIKMFTQSPVNQYDIFSIVEKDIAARYGYEK